MTTSLIPALALDDGGDLVAAIPHLLGFHPIESLVVVTLLDDDGGGGGIHVGPVLRVDLPAARHRAALARQVSEIAAAHRVAMALVVVVGGDRADPPAALPHRGLVREVERAYAAVGVPVEHAMWAPHTREGAAWWCYSDPECTGTVPDPDTSPLAAAMAVIGAVKYPSREALAASLAPDSSVAVARRAAMLAAAAPPSAGDVGRHLSLVRAAVAVCAPPPGVDSPTPQEVFDDPHLVALALALRDSTVRGECIALALTDQARPAELLWNLLTRLLPAPDRAEPACLLAICAYLRGDGPCARVALDLALEARPTHSLAALLAGAVDRAICPAELRRIIEDAHGCAEGGDD